jgi:predicted glutamine amidotransferase
VVVTAPLTLDEPWTAFVPGEVMVFKDGVLLEAAKRLA